MAVTDVRSPYNFQEEVTFSSTVTLPPDAVVGSMIASRTIEADNLKSDRRAFNFTASGNIAAASPLIHQIRGTTGTIIAVEACVLTAAGGDRTATIDLQKGNASTAFATTLSTTIAINSGIAVRTQVAGVVNTSLATLDDGDILRLNITVGGSSGTQPADVLVTVWIEENL